ncbi:hypothetical protein HK098_007283 [Nowakowskiella sp. JEL0407]|nr:hypothetical protein HK098_007283 [Nowakowskiella sp. JEL0407]
MMKFIQLIAVLSFAAAISAIPAPTGTSCTVADRNEISIFNDLVDSHSDAEYCKIKDLPNPNNYYPLNLIGNLPELNVTIPDAIKPPANASVKLFALKAIGVRKYQCLRITDAPTYGWSEQVSSACLFRDDPSKLQGLYKRPVSLLVFNPTTPGRAYYGAAQRPQSAFQVSQVSRVPGATASDLSWELATGVNHLYEEGPLPTVFDFRKALYHNRVLTQGGAAPSASLCTADNEGDRVIQDFSAWIIFYGAENFTCPLV